MTQNPNDKSNSAVGVLVVDDDEMVADSMVDFLASEGYRARAASGGEAVRSVIASGEVDIVVSDVAMPEMDGFGLLEFVRENKPDVPVILVTGYGTIADAVRAIRGGAFDYITKPVDDDALLLALQRALRQQELVRENIELKRRVDEADRPAPLDRLLGRDPAMRKILHTLKRVADTRTTVLVTGESGTGKTLIARTIHESSERREAPFVEVTCGNIPETLLESDLFGHVKGSFTGAHRDKTGKFEAADGGTIFLDEIANASPSLQVKLLRVLQDFEFEKVGGNDTQRTDARVILATNRDLRELVEAGEFREDLYYRINVVHVEVPPLRERRVDLPYLVNYFVDKHTRANRREVTGVEEEALRALQRYGWPGNVRELENTIESGVVLTDGPHIGLDDLPPHIVEGGGESRSPEDAGIDPTVDTPGETVGERTLQEAMDDWERRLIVVTLEQVKGSRNQAAERLGINRTTLFNKMKKYGLMDAG